jgi:hypothetical protein
MLSIGLRSTPIPRRHITRIWRALGAWLQHRRIFQVYSATCHGLQHGDRSCQSAVCVLFTCALLLVLSVVCAVASFLSRSTHGSGCVLRFLGAASRFYSSGGFQFKARAPLSGSTHEGSPNTCGIATFSWHGQFNATQAQPTRN